MLRVCHDTPALKHLYRFFWCTLSPAASILGINNLSLEGMQQGDSAGSAGFSIPLQPQAEWANAELKKVGGMALFDMDDGYLMGPINEVMRVVRQFQARLQQHVGSVLNPIKCKLWCHRDHREEAQEFLDSTGETQFALGHINLPCGRPVYGVKVSGVPFGDEDYVQ